MTRLHLTMAEYLRNILPTGGFHMTPEKKLGNVGLIGRFKPLHIGAAVMLEEVCKASWHATIGIGSSNMHNARNTFTAEETMDMFNAYLGGKFENYDVIKLEQFGHTQE